MGSTMLDSHGYAAMKANGALAPFAFERRDPEPTERRPAKGSSVVSPGCSV